MWDALPLLVARKAAALAARPNFEVISATRVSEIAPRKNDRRLVPSWTLRDACEEGAKAG